MSAQPRPLFRWQTAIAFALGAAAAFPIGMAWGDTGALIDVTVSPDGRHRLELYRPSRWQRLTGHDDGDFAVARLSTTGVARVISVSPPFHVTGAGATVWSPGAVQVGMAARYDHATRRWSVQ